MHGQDSCTAGDITLPPLPTEVWRCIFRKATRVEGGLPHQSSTPLFQISFPCDSEERAFETQGQVAVQTESSLSRVSRRWRSIAIECQLEALIVKARALGPQFEGLNLFDFNADALPSQFVWHMYVQDDHSALPANTLPLLRLVKACTNLSTYEHREDGYPASNFESFLRCCASSLRCLRPGQIRLEAE